MELLKEIFGWEGNLKQKFSLLIFVINLFINPVICFGKDIIGEHSMKFGEGNFFYYYKLGYRDGITYQELYLLILIGVVSLFSIYLFGRDK
jgi:hypothetical protein